ncbi:hypothetical protein [Actinomycetospora sp. TBRC 11914]|uniref:hypothetical protein n=1 Tax=Actinomycetospora sp. TBRC 11914 TaxID=2729387 RepID=UPI00145F7455|nr:hypothetical protein [Actinomycetospora sp. TBRC 11914]NMO93034.1 hypothetical protein [Actinomycetospora sp. TBRC 11914]
MALVAHGWAAPAAVDPESASAPEPATGLVEGLAALPGAEYVLAVDAGGDRVRGESGGPPGPAMAIVDWARRVADISHERHHDLEDLVLTTDDAFHLVRLVTTDPADRGPLWVTVRIDRARGNLAWSRRALAGLGSPVSLPGPRALGPAPSAPARPSHPLEPAAPLPASSAPVGPARSSWPTSPGPTGPTMPAAPAAASAPWPGPSASGGSAMPTLAGSSPTSSGPAAPPSSTGPEAPRRSWFTPSASSASSPAEARRAWAPRRPDPEAASSWFSPSTSAAPWPSPAPGTPEGPAAASPGTGPVAMPAPARPAEDRPVDVPGPRDEQPPVARTGQDRAITQLPRPERGPTGKKGTADARSSRRLPLTVREGVWWSGRTERPDMPELGPPTGPTPVVSATGVVGPTVPAARTSAEDPPAPPVPAPRDPNNLFAPVVVVPPPPSPVPEDDTTEMPAPMPAPVIHAVPLEVARPEPAEEPDAAPDDAAPDEAGPDDAAPDAETTDDAVPAGEETAEAGDEPVVEELPDLPRRRPGSHLPAGLPATPRSVPAVRPAAAVAGTAAFTTEPSVLRRLIDGLRRLS